MLCYIFERNGSVSKVGCTYPTFVSPENNLIKTSRSARNSITVIQNQF